MKYTALVVPASIYEPVQVTEYDDEDTMNMNELLTGSRTGVLSFSSFPQAGVLAAYDDLGLYREPAQTNLRAQMIWSKLRGVALSHVPHLVGHFLFLGVDEAGETKDVPPFMIEFAQGLHRATKELIARMSEEEEWDDE